MTLKNPYITKNKNSVSPFLILNKEQSTDSQNEILERNRYKKYYEQIICSDLLLKHNYKTIMELPSLKKIILNTTSKSYSIDKKNILPVLMAMELISGQKAKLTSAKKSIASFKIRENQIIGCKVTLRYLSMFFFLDKLLTIVLPRIREFSAIEIKNFDNIGNFSLGITNILIFPEIENHFELFEGIRGLNINIVIAAQNKKEALVFYSALQIPHE
jgi:large subunit ribosomal protein L5